MVGVRTVWTFFLLPTAALALSPSFAEANSGDFSGAVAIGTSYGGQITAPTNGLIVQGNVGIGTSSPNAVPFTATLNSGGVPNSTFTTNEIFQLVGATGSPALIEIDGIAQTTGFVGVRYNTSIAGKTAVQNDDQLFGFSGTGYNGSTLGGNQAVVALYAGGNWSTTSEPTYIYFATTPVNSTGRVEAMRITSSGAIGMGTTAPRGGALLDVNGSVRVGSFAAGSSTTVCQNANVLSSCTSALRFKENIKPYQMGLKEVLEMKPVTFDQRDHKDGWEKHDFGFVAEDMEKINPIFVTYDENRKINGVRYMQMTAVNTKAIQEMQAEIDELKHTIQELKHQQ